MIFLWIKEVLPIVGNFFLSNVCQNNIYSSTLSILPVYPIRNLWSWSFTWGIFVCFSLVTNRRGDWKWQYFVSVRCCNLIPYLRYLLFEITWMLALNNRSIFISLHHKRFCIAACSRKIYFLLNFVISLQFYHNY